jgi:hypothetical protein
MRATAAGARSGSMVVGSTIVQKQEWDGNAGLE